MTEAEKKYKESFDRLKTKIGSVVSRNVTTAASMMECQYPKGLADISGELAHLHMVFHDIVNESWKTALEGMSVFVDENTRKEK